MDALDPLEPLLAYLERVPAMQLPAGRRSIGAGIADSGRWWVKFSLDTNHPLAWRVVQELGHVLNYVSVDNRLPTDCAKWLQSRLPDPVGNLDAWQTNE